MAVFHGTVFYELAFVPLHEQLVTYNYLFHRGW
jgi:hypothetical protein